MKNQLIFKMRQTGVVLFIALIALVVMSLAAVALIRSVDTNTVIAGNLAFKQSAVVASDSGVEAAFSWLNTAATANLATLNDNVVAQAYHATIPDLHQLPATYTEPNLEDLAELKNVATWANSVTIPSLGDGNTISYIIQRMCLKNVAPEDPANSCLYGDIPTGGESIDNDNQPKLGANFQVVPSPMYRVTVRVNGPKNTVSYTQAYTY
jgi:Tfp pilus assembly protein PilX